LRPPRRPYRKNPRRDIGHVSIRGGTDVVLTAAIREGSFGNIFSKNFRKCLYMVGVSDKVKQFSRRKDRVMRKPIQDEFTYLPISRQRKYQLRMKRDKRCTECGEPAAEGSRCVKHLVKARERQRKKRGLKRRYYSTLSYKLQAAK
jgi:hypothetical protein